MEVDKYENDNVLILSTSQSTKDKLNENFLCRVFLHSVFLNWPTETIQTPVGFGIKISYVVFLLYFVGTTLYSVVGYINEGMNSIAVSELDGVLEYMASCCYLLEILSLVVAIYFGYYRLLKHVNVLEMQYYERASALCLAFEVVFFVIALITCPLLDYISFNHSYLEESLIPVEWMSSLGVAISLCFIIVDARCSAAMVQDLCSLADNHSLTIAQVTATRVEIQRRVKDSLFINAWIVVVAVFHSLVFVGVVISNFPFLNLELFGLEIAVATTLYLKEAVYLLIALIEISHVNDLADKLHSLLGKLNWTDGDDEEQNSLTNVFTEQRRLRMFVSISSDPISFHLLGTRPTRLSVCLQVVGYVGSLVALTVKSYLTS